MAINVDNTLHQRDRPLQLDNAKKYITKRLTDQQMCEWRIPMSP